MHFAHYICTFHNKVVLKFLCFPWHNKKLNAYSRAHVFCMYIDTFMSLCLDLTMKWILFSSAKDISQYSPFQKRGMRGNYGLFRKNWKETDVRKCALSFYNYFYNKKETHIRIHTLYKFPSCRFYSTFPLNSHTFRWKLAQSTFTFNFLFLFRFLSFSCLYEFLSFLVQPLSSWWSSA